MRRCSTTDEKQTEETVLGICPDMSYRGIDADTMKKCVGPDCQQWIEAWKPIIIGLAPDPYEYYVFRGCGKIAVRPWSKEKYKKRPPPDQRVLTEVNDP